MNQTLMTQTLKRLKYYKDSTLTILCVNDRSEEESYVGMLEEVIVNPSEGLLNPKIKLRVEEAEEYFVELCLTSWEYGLQRSEFKIITEISTTVCLHKSRTLYDWMAKDNILTKRRKKTLQLTINPVDLKFDSIRRALVDEHCQLSLFAYHGRICAHIFKEKDETRAWGENINVRRALELADENLKYDEELIQKPNLSASEIAISTWIKSNQRINLRYHEDKIICDFITGLGKKEHAHVKLACHKAFTELLCNLPLSHLRSVVLKKYASKD